MALTKADKVCPMVVRRRGGAWQVLAFRHPSAGIQLVKGGLNPGEAAHEAAIRELYEESGIALTARPRDIGAYRIGVPGEVWRIFVAEGRDMPEAWAWQTLDDHGHTFRFFWQNVHVAPGPGWRKTYLEALYRLRDWIEYKSGTTPIQLPPASPPAL